MLGWYGAPQSSALTDQSGDAVTLHSGERRQSLRLTVDVGLTIDGMVTDDGAPVPFASVGLNAADKHNFSRSTRTNALESSASGLS